MPCQAGALAGGLGQLSRLPYIIARFGPSGSVVQKEKEETISNWGLRHFQERNIRFGHCWIPPFEGSPEVVVEHLGSHLQE